MLLGIYYMIDEFYLQRIASGNQFTVSRPTDDDMDKYMEIGKECIGWITIEDTNIDYPIMQAKDNTKYLNTAPDGSYSLAGSIFLDWACSPHFDDGYSLIYGHHMSSSSPTEKYGKMFGGLDGYRDKDYFDTHKACKLTFDGQIHDATVFGFMITDANQKILFDPSSYDNQYDYIKKNATYFEEPVDKNHIVTAVTCKDPGTTERTAIFLSFTD